MHVSACLCGREYVLKCVPRYVVVYKGRKKNQQSALRTIMNSKTYQILPKKAKMTGCGGNEFIYRGYSTILSPALFVSERIGKCNDIQWTKT